MLPQPGYIPRPNVSTADEFRAILKERSEFLASCTATVTGGDPLPIPWRTGWTATVAILGRSQDGSLLAVLTCRGPHAAQRWIRKIRLVPEQRLKLK